MAFISLKTALGGENNSFPANYTIDNAGRNLKVHEKSDDDLREILEPKYYMKPVGRFSKAMVYVALACSLMAISSEAAQMLVNKAVVRAARNATQYKVGKGSWKPIKVGMIFNPNTAVQTGADSSIDLFLNDNGPVVRVTANTELSLDKLDITDTGVEKIINTQLDLRSGRILGNVKHLAEASKYEVKTPRGVAGIRGTDYDIRADGTVHVITGTVVMVYVTPAGPRPVTVNAGQTATPPVGNAPPIVQQTTDPTVGQQSRDLPTNFTPQNNPPPPPESPVQSATPTPPPPPPTDTGVTPPPTTTKPPVTEETVSPDK